ncbi:unnamed protein product [Durusdinium trenchii]|uniref:Apple domain-containing protein n=1 Tax=Durusdinium trenchii TaxID=1381693 RepID=A0ABP0PRV3_9DINO
MAWLRGLLLLEVVLLIPVVADTLGCFHYGFAFTNPLSNITGNPFNVVSADECQMQCKNTIGCSNFGYYPVSGACYLGHGGVLYAIQGAIAGPKECPSLNPACTALPDPSFPAETPPQTMEAWPGGVQPTPLQCWPRWSDGLPSRCRNQTASVLEDTEDGWPGQCDGMVKIVDLRGGETCQTRCMLTPLCSVWAIESSSDAYGAAVCWHGMLGHNCSHNSNGIRPSRAQRLQHGTYRVLMQTVGVQILGLHNSFGGTVYGDWQEGAKHCKLECRSYLLCQYWQYSRVYGCFLEMPQRSAVGYPLTTTGVFRSVNRNSEAARDIVAGEMIQHNCVGEMSAIPTAAPSAGESQLVVPGISPETQPATAGSAWPWWINMVLFAALCLCLSVIGAAVWMGLEERAKRRARHGGNLRQAWSTPGHGQDPKLHGYSPAAQHGQEATSSFMQNIHMPQMPHFQMPGYGSQGPPPPNMHREAHRQTRGGRYF